LRKSGDFVRTQIGRVVVSALFEVPAQQEVMLQRFHVFLEVGYSSLSLRHGGVQPIGCLLQLA